MSTAIQPLLQQRSELHAEVERLLKERGELRAQVERLLKERGELRAQVERLLRERGELPAEADRAALRAHIERLWAALLVARRWIPESPISPIAAEDLRIVNKALRSVPRTPEQKRDSGK
jgi:predicted RNase H-like nuclease (RuvC/YqgF family)